MRSGPKVIAALPAGGTQANELIEVRSIAEWIAWAEARAATTDPTEQAPERLWGDVSSVTAWTHHS